MSNDITHRSFFGSPFVTAFEPFKWPEVVKWNSVYDDRIYPYKWTYFKDTCLYKTPWQGHELEGTLTFKCGEDKETEIAGYTGPAFSLSGQNGPLPHAVKDMYKNDTLISVRQRSKAFKDHYCNTPMTFLQWLSFLRDQKLIRDGINQLQEQIIIKSLQQS